MSRVLALLVIVALVACQPASGGDPAEAGRLARSYLEAVSGGADDRGWPLILHESRRAYATQDAYLAAVESADWTGFSWDVLEEGTYCEDGGVYCVVRLQVDGVPPFLLSAPRSEPEDLLQTIIMDDDAVSVGNAQLVVYFARDGDRGVSLGGR